MNIHSFFHDIMLYL